MPSSPADPEIVDVPDESRLVAVKDSTEAELVYRVEDGRLVVVHTGVPEQLEGHGLGARLVRSALDKAEREQRTLVPLCPFARRWLREHPDDARRVAVDWHLSQKR